MPRDLQYYKGKLLTLRSAIDDLLVEMEAEPSAQPRKRRNLKAQRILQCSDTAWRKPTELKKKRA